MQLGSHLRFDWWSLYLIHGNQIGKYRYTRTCMAILPTWTGRGHRKDTTEASNPPASFSPASIMTSSSMFFPEQLQPRNDTVDIENKN
jgi:hypothetical protein